MEYDIDMNVLISLVESRPVLWDNTVESYKNKQANFMAWKEIYIKLYEDFEQLSDQGKIEFGEFALFI